ncbi:MAG: DUF2332 domain-containing protein [Solirubrobacterales bacterium]
MEPREQLLATLGVTAGVADAMSPGFYGPLLASMRSDVAEGGPTLRLLEPFAAEPPTEYYGFRALAGVHRMVLAGHAPELEARYPSVGGDGDADAAWPHVRERFAAHPPELLAKVRHPLQTNDTSRCGALIGGYLTIARDTGLPLRVRALGASAGLNLHFDMYRYEAGGLAHGPTDSKVRFVDHWLQGIPPLDAAMTVADRRGCDIDPLDPTTAEGRLELESCVFADDLPRLELLRATLDIAAGMPVEVDQASADEWVAGELKTLPDGRATVVSHSIFWIYPAQRIRDGITAAIDEAGTRSTRERPLAWLRYEPGEQPTTVELRLTTWPGGEERLLATGGHHMEPVAWLD